MTLRYLCVLLFPAVKKHSPQSRRERRGYAEKFQSKAQYYNNYITTIIIPR